MEALEAHLLKLQALESRQHKLEAYLREYNTYTLKHEGPEQITVVQLASEPVYVLATYEVFADIEPLKGKLPEGTLYRSARAESFPAWMKGKWTNVCGMSTGDQELYLRRTGDRVQLDFMFKLLGPDDCDWLKRERIPVPDLAEYIQWRSKTTKSLFPWLHGAQTATLTLLRTAGLLQGTATPAEVAFVKNASEVGQTVPDILLKLADGHEAAIVQIGQWEDEIEDESE